MQIAGGLQPPVSIRRPWLSTFRTSIFAGAPINEMAPLRTDVLRVRGGAVV
ncbi:MAG: hypothetical protein QM765_05245 [Myxococcales bacterium]